MEHLDLKFEKMYNHIKLYQLLTSKVLVYQSLCHLHNRIQRPIRENLLILFQLLQKFCFIHITSIISSAFYIQES